VFNKDQQNAGVVAGNVQQVLLALRGAAHDAGNVCGWVVAQTAADLQAIGFLAGDVTQLQAICGDIVTLLTAASGGPPAPQKDYITEALPLIGPNTR
jgi:hypothetical protein